MADETKPEGAPGGEAPKPQAGPKPEKAEKPRPEQAGKPKPEQAKASKGEGGGKGGPKGGGEGASKKPAGGGHVKPVKLRLKERYLNEVVPKLMEKSGVKNKLAVPRLKKICVNVGFGKAATENLPKLMEQCVNDVTTITGQKAVVTRSRKSISNFKLRQGMQVGCRVTLRGPTMYEFFDRLVNVAIPRIRDFRGLSPRAFDGRGNYSMGLQEQTVFPEIDPDKVEFVHGMDITICTNARDDEQARNLLRELGFPFRDR